MIFPWSRNQDSVAFASLPGRSVLVGTGFCLLRWKALIALTAAHRLLRGERRNRRLRACADDLI